MNVKEKWNSQPHLCLTESHNNLNVLTSRRGKSVYQYLQNQTWGTRRRTLGLRTYIYLTLTLARKSLEVYVWILQNECLSPCSTPPCKTPEVPLPPTPHAPTLLHDQLLPSNFSLGLAQSFSPWSHSFGELKGLWSCRSCVKVGPLTHVASIWMLQSSLTVPAIERAPPFRRVVSPQLQWLDGMKTLSLSPVVPNQPSSFSHAYSYSPEDKDWNYVAWSFLHLSLSDLPFSLLSHHQMSSYGDMLVEIRQPRQLYEFLLK